MIKPKKGFNWARWIFIIIALFIICLLIWMFVALSDNAIDHAENVAHVFLKG